MIDKQYEEFLKGLEEVDTGKAQPLFHPFPVINIFREDDPVKKIYKTDQPTEEQKLMGMKGIIWDVSAVLKPEIKRQMERHGAWYVLPEKCEDYPDFIAAMDKDTAFLKSIKMNGFAALKATFGLISRFGMETDAPSLAQPAIAAKNVTVLAIVLEAIAGVDAWDPMSRDAYIYDFTEALKNDLAGMKIGVIPYIPEGTLYEEQKKENFEQMLQLLTEKGAEVEEVSIDWIEYVLPVHEMIEACEMRMCATAEELQEAGESDVVALADYLLREDNYEKYYLKLLKLRSLIKDAYDIMLRDYSILIMPFLEDTDAYSLGANLAGLPAMTMPTAYKSVQSSDSIKTGFSGREMIAGVHMIAGANCENNLLRIAYTLEQGVL